MPNERHDTERRLADLLSSAAEAARQHAETCRRDSRGQDDTERAWLIGSATMAENLANRLDDYARSHGAKPRPTAAPPPGVPRLDLSKPPPDFDLDDLPRALTMTVRTAGVWGPNVLAAAWAHHKARHDPPGMWSGYTGILPDCTQWRPRMGVSIAGLARLELYVGADRPGALEEAKAIGRAAAWAWYEDALEVADLLDIMPARRLSSLGVVAPAFWPRALAWTDEQRAEVRRWAAWFSTTGQKVARPPALPEVLRG